MGITVEELNQAADWSQTPAAAKAIPTPTVPSLEGGKVGVPLDEMNSFSEHTVTTRDAPKSFWRRRLSDAQLSFDQTPHAVGSALIFLGDTIRGKNAPPLIPTDKPFLKDFAENLEVQMDGDHWGQVGDTIGSAFIRMGLSWQDLSENLAAEHSKGMEEQTDADKYLSDLTKMGTGMAGLIGTAIVAGPLVAAGSFVLPTSFETYDRARQKGKDYEEAVKIAGAMGIATGTPAFIGLGAVFKLSGPLIQRMVLGAGISGVDLAVMRGGSETVERVSGITDSQAQGWDSVKEAVALAVRDGSMGMILGTGVGAVNYGMSKRQEIKEKLRSIGMKEEQAVKAADTLMSKGMDQVLKTVEQEKILVENKIFRDPDGNFVNADGSSIAPERVVATLTKGAGESLPLVEKAKVVAAEALPQRETVGVTKEERAFVEPVKTDMVKEELPSNVAATIEAKFKKIEDNMKRAEPKTKARIKVIQKEVEDFVKHSGLELKDKAKFLSSIKNVQTFQQLERALPELRERIGELREKTNLNKEIARYKDLTQPSVIKKTRAEYQKTIKQITEELTPTKVSVPKAMTLESLAKHLEAEPESIIPEYKLAELKALDKKSLRDMTSEEVKTINDAIAHLYKLEELKTSILEKNKYVSLEKTVNEVVGNIKAGGKTAGEIKTGIETVKTRKQMAKNYFGLDSRDAETNLIIVEGKDGGKFQQVIFGGLNQAKTDYLRYIMAARQILRRGIEGIDITKWSQYVTADIKKLDLIPFTFSERKVSLTKAQAIAFHLLMQRQEGANHILEGGFSIRGKLADVVKVTPENAQAVSDYVLSNPQMAKVAENLHAYFNGFQKQAINATAYQLTGLEIATTPNYFRIVVDPLYRKTNPELKKYSGKVAIEGLGFLKETVPSKIPVILEDAFQVAYESLHLSGSYVAYAEHLRAAKEVLNDGRVKQELTRVGREDFLKSFEKYVQRVEGEVVDLSNLEALSRDLIVKIQTSVLMLNPGILLKQPTSLFAAMTEMEAKMLLKNYKVAATKEEVAEIAKWSPQLAARWEGHITRELGELKNAGQIEELFTGRIGWTEKFMAAYQTMDHPMVATIWRTAKEEVRSRWLPEKGDIKSAEYFKQVAERAEFVMRRTQASVFVEHRSENLAKRDMFSRGVSLFSSETNKQFAMVSRAVEQFNKSPRKLSDGVELARKLFIVSYLNSLLIATINLGGNIWKQSSDKGRKDEEKKDWELITKKFVTDVILGPLGMFYGIRDLANIVQSELVYGDVAHEVNNPVGSLATDFGKGIGDLMKAGSEFLSGEEYQRKTGEHKKGDKKWTVTLSRAIMQLTESISAAKGLPVSNVLRWGAPMFNEVGKFFGVK